MNRNMFISMFRNSAKKFLTLCLLIISFTLSMISLMDSFSYKIQKSENEDLYSYNTDEVYRLDVIHIDENEFDKVGEGLNDIKEIIRNQIGLTIGAYCDTTDRFDELSINNTYIDRNRELFRGGYEEKSPEMSKIIFMDSQMACFLNNGLTQEMFEPVIMAGEEYLPIYAGKAYEGIFSIGDKLTLSRTGDKYVFCGYLDAIKWFGLFPIENPTRMLEHYFFAPFCESEKTDSMTQLSTTHGIHVRIPEKAEIIEKEISEIAAMYNIRIRITSVSEIIDNWESETRERLGYYRKLANMFIVCAASSITALMAVSVILDKKTIGIKIAYGSNKRKIIVNLHISLGIQVLFALICSILLVMHKIYTQTDTIEMANLLYKTLWKISVPQTIAVGVIIMIVVGIIPLGLIKKFDVASAIK